VRDVPPELAEEDELKSNTGGEVYGDEYALVPGDPFVGSTADGLVVSWSDPLRSQT